MNFIKTSLAIFIFSAAANATPLDSARTIENKTNAASIVSQNKINRDADSAIAMKAEVEQLQDEVKNLQVYRDHLARLVENQDQEVTSIAQQIDNIKETRQGVVPLMYDMIAGLSTLVNQDMPIKRQHRLTRMAKLNTMMGQADISDAEKFRRILEAYQIEMDYGTKLATYQDKITLADGKTIEANMLHVGRVVFVARSLNGTQYWRWNNTAKQWQVLDSGESTSIDTAYAMANNLIAPSLLRLPVSASLIAAEKP